MQLLLTQIKKRVRIDLRYIFENGSYLFSGNVISALCALITAIAFSNLIDPETYGNYKYVITLAGLAMAFSLSGAASAVTRSVAQGNYATYIRLFYSHLCWNIPSIFLLLLGSLYYWIQGNAVLSVSLLLVAGFDPLTKSLSLGLAYLGGVRDFRMISYLQSLRAVLLTATMVTTVIYYDQVVVILTFYFLINLLLSGFEFFIIKKRIPKVDQSPHSDAPQYALNLSLMNIISNIGKHVDSILLFQMTNGTALAIYSFARIPIHEMQRVDDIIKQLTLPKLASRPLCEIRREIVHKMLLFTLLLASIVLVYIALSPFLFKILFPNYLSAIPLTQVMSLEILFTSSILLTQTLVAHKKTAALYIKRTVIPLLKIVLLIICIPLFGLWGVVFSMLAARATDATLTAFLFWYYSRETKSA